ncbi:unnamed protein product [Orchesella dallaii]|uniref:Uncharacterized protein n=1 Tax=Orchesella dallaii TaxID=48710 RepID=A0ABP1S4S0_9HEXA
MSTFRLEIVLLLLICWNCTSSGKEIKKVTIFKEENFQGEKYERLSSENCTNLPEDLQLRQGSILTSGCVTFYVDKDCTGGPVIGFVVQSREKSLEEALRLCQLSMMAFNLEPALDVNSFGGTIKNVAIDVKQTFINDGPGTMEERYEVERTVKETATFRVSKSLRNLVKSSNSVNTTYENGTSGGFAAGFDGSVNTPKVGPASGTVMGGIHASEKLTTKLEQVITDETKSEKEGSATNGTDRGISTERSFKVEKTIIVQPCTSYEVSSFVKMSKNVEIDYYMHFEITGVTTTGQQMTYENLQIGIESQTNSEEGLEVLHGHPRANNVTVVVQLRIQLIANLGMNSVVTGKGVPLKECQRRIAHCNCCDSDEDETDVDEADVDEAGGDETGGDETGGDETDVD